MKYIKKDLISLNRYLAMAFILLLPAMGVFASQPEKKPLNDLSDLILDIQKQHIVVWQLDMKYDPYLDGQVLRSDPDRPVFLIMAMDFTFIMLDGDQKREGRWLVDPENETISFKGEKINDISIGTTDIQVYKLKQYDADKLVLTWQGRHGWVDMVYTQIDTTEIHPQIISSLR